MSIPTRVTLLRRIKDLDDQSSWRDFFDTYWKLIYEVSRRAGLSDAESQDVVQETVIAVARKMPSFEYQPGRDSFKGWLLQLTRRKITDQYRKRQPATSAEAEEPLEPGRTAFIDRIPDPAGLALEAVWEEEWRNNLLSAGLKRLKRQASPEHYAIFRLYAIKKQPAAKVAATLGVPEEQVWVIGGRLSEMLKKEVKDLETKLL